MLYKNKKGIVHNLSPKAALTKRWLEQGNLTPLTDEEKKDYADEAKVAKAAPLKNPTAEDVPPMPARDEMDAEHTALFGKDAMATMKDENLWKKILAKREEVAAAGVAATTTEAK